MNTDASRQNPFGLIIALDDESSAQGSLYYDDGNSIGNLHSHLRHKQAHSSIK